MTADLASAHDIDAPAVRVTVAVSTVIFALRPHPTSGLPTLWVPLVRRIREPFRDQWALPGGPLGADTDLVTSARATLARTTGLTPRHLEQLYSFGDVDRGHGATERDRVVSIVYWALVRAAEADQAVETENVRWFVADEVPALAFDHNRIVTYALARLRAKMTYSPVAHAFLDEEFTLAQLREVHEAVLQRTLDPANFRRQALTAGTVVATGRFLTGTSHRPPALYRSAARSTPQPEEQA